MPDLLSRAAAQQPEPVPPGARVLDVTRVVGHGPADLAAAAEVLATWGAQRAVGFRVRSDARADQPGATVLLGVGVGRVARWWGCRVVEVLSSDTAAGFAYATLPGHPEAGTERFTVELTPEGTVVGRVQAWSRPAAWWARLAGPLGRQVQRVVAGRYLAALRRR